MQYAARWSAPGAPVVEKHKAGEVRIGRNGNVMLVLHGYEVAMVPDDALSMADAIIRLHRKTAPIVEE